MVTFIALFRGSSIEHAKLVGVCADRELVSSTAIHILDTLYPELDTDPAVRALLEGRKEALRLIAERDQDS